MRLFVAIDLTDDARAEVARLQRRVAEHLGGRGGLRLVHQEHLHLTLVFIGEVDEPRAASIGSSMAAPFDVAPFELVFGGLGVFPPVGPPRVLWLGVTAGADAVGALQQQVCLRLARLAEGPGNNRREWGSERPFSPHLTLGRWRRSRQSDGRRALAETVGAVARVPVAAVTLYESRLSSSGPSHLALCHTSLKRTAESV